VKNSFKRIGLLLLSTLLIAMNCVSVFTVTATAANDGPLKTRATYFTDEKLANMKENIEKYSWAASSATNSINAAEAYLKLYSLEDLWSLLPSQQVYRSYGVNQTYGCLNCGNAIDAYGNYPYKHDHKTEPWKITCPNCNYKFPTNDFESYYKSGLDKNGIFSRSRADKKYLVNTLYPEKGEKWGVDDGTYYTHTDGKKYFFVAYYCHWELWYSGIIKDAMVHLYNAYLYTGEQKYADASIVILNRMGDLYPSFNISDCPWSEGYRHSGVNNGKIIGSIWETGLVNDYTLAYDALFRAFPTMGEEALNLLKSKDSGIKSYKDVMKNIEDGFIKTIYPTVKAGNIRGNNGMHQRSLALAAVVLDDPILSKEWLDYVFRAGKVGTGGNVSATFVDDVDRDGWGNESAPGYNILWLNCYLDMANFLRGYTINGTDLSYDLYENVKFKKMFASAVQILATPDFAPNIGDSGSTGSSGVVASNAYLIQAYLKYGDPEYAQMIHFLARGNVDDIRLTIYDKDPESLPEKIKAVIAEKGEYQLTSRLLSGYGLATLMNINAAEAIPVTEDTSAEFVGNDFSIINAKEMTNAVRSESGVTFTPQAAGDTLSLGFYLNTQAAVYEVIVYSLGAANAGEYNVFVDGKLLQAAVDFNTKAGKKEAVYFKRTLDLIPGYHVISFQAAEKVGPINLEGLKVMKSGTSVSTDYHNERTSLTMYFGRNTGHGHKDTLNLELYAFGINMTPEMGYPEFCDGTPHMIYWVQNTVSHNTVTINDQQMGAQIVSDPKAFDSNDLVSLISVDATKVYPAAEKYMRTSALIKYNNEYSYVLDFFSVKGGKKHTYVFHPADSMDPITTGLEFTPQVDENGNYVGTLMGKNVAWGTGGSGTGYQYLDKVRIDEDPDAQFSFDWQITETRYTTAQDMHLKFSMLNQVDKVVLANGTPPRNKAGNPKGLDYVLASTEKSKNNSTLFVSVMEPYIQNSYIVSTEFVPVTTSNGEVNNDSIKAVKVTFVNGRVDYVVYSEEPNATYTIDKKFYFKGFFGICSIRDGEVVMYTNDATMSEVEAPTRYTGKVKDFTRDLAMENYIYVTFDSEVDLDKIIGNQIFVENDSVRNAVYTILDAKKQEDGSYALFIGDITTIRSYRTATVPNAGFIYDVAVNREFYIPFRDVQGDASLITKGSNSPIADITLSNNIKSDAKAGDKVGSLYVIRKNISALYQLPDYELTIAAGEDGEMFEIKDGWLYLSDKFVADKKDYKVAIKVFDSATEDTKTVTVSIPVLSKSQSKSQIYPEFSLKETEASAEFIVKAPSDGVEDNTAPSAINWIAICITAAICAAVLGITAILTKKKA